MNPLKKKKYILPLAYIASLLSIANTPKTLLAKDISLNPRAQQTLHQLEILPQLLQLPSFKNYFLSQEAAYKRKNITFQLTITFDDLSTKRKNNSILYTLSLKQFFQKWIKKYPYKKFYFPIQIQSIRLLYEGKNESKLGWSPNPSFTKWCSNYQDEQGLAKAMFQSQNYWYQPHYYLFWTTPDPQMKTIVFLDCLTVDNLENEKKLLWNHDLYRWKTIQNKFTKTFAHLPPTLQPLQTLKHIQNFLKSLSYTYRNSNQKVRNYIETHYSQTWLPQIQQILDKKNQEIQQILQNLQKLEKHLQQHPQQLPQHLQQLFQLQQEFHQKQNLSQLFQFLQNIQQKLQQLTQNP
ncbi:MAG: hypothetical protein D6805_04710 [Planctomycetota bacterium]|nr:MAG: hypothetical protein D6805_04710 [Planctomycetota bacterium]